jgi:excisionase family DNA binding protein
MAETEMMNTHEVAAYLRIKERKVYDLVRGQRIPCTRVTGKWLFSKRLIDGWLRRHTEPGRQAERTEPPAPVVAGSHDPLLEWSLRESGCGLALLSLGSMDGLRRLVAGEAMLCGLHLFDEAGEYNVAAVSGTLGRGAVAIEWGWRQQGLVLAPGNPLGIRALADLREKGARIVTRQADSGSQFLLLHLLSRAGIDFSALKVSPRPARNETDIGFAVLEGKADAGLAVAAVAHQLKLDFLPLHRERYDLVLRHFDYFEPPFQRLLAFTRTNAFAERAAEMGGYEVSRLGRVTVNLP